jgi:chromosome segregation ATPase
MPENVTRIRSSDTISRVAVLESQMENLGHNIEVLEGKVETQYNALHSRISDMRDDVHKEISDKHQKLIDKLDDQTKLQTEQHKDLNKKVSDFEKWRWMIMGGALVIGYVLAHIKLERFF